MASHYLRDVSLIFCIFSTEFIKLRAFSINIPFFRVPFERNTVMEYFVKQTIIVLGGPAYLTTMMTSTTFFINCHSLLGVGMSDMKSSFAELDEFMKHRGQRNLDELESRMIQIVELHNRLRK